MILFDPRKSDSIDSSAWTWVLCGRVAPDQPVMRVALTGEVFPIGRHEQNRLCLANKTVSNCHAELVCLPEGLLVRDLDSTNGTFLNGQRLDSPQLAGPGDILQFGSAIFTLEFADASTKPLTEKCDVGDEGVGRMHFRQLFQNAGLRPFYQPIVRLDQDQSRVGFEALARSHLVGLETPESMFKVAAERNAEIELSCHLRLESLKHANILTPGEQIFLNTHPVELTHPRFLESIRQLRRAFPERSIMVEIHEAAVTDLDLLRRIREVLCDFEMGLSYDDFGAGQARLLELGEVPPDVLKFDVQLIHDLPNATRERQRLVECLVKVTQEMGILALAECVETETELELCRQMGFDLAQGFFLGHPAPIEHWTHRDTT